MEVDETETIALAGSALVVPSGVVSDTVDPVVKLAPVSVTAVDAGLV